MLKKFIAITLLAFISHIAYSQDIALSFIQGGMYCEGRTASNKYFLESRGQICSFDASYAKAANGTIVMTVYNPSINGYIPAIYHLYPNNTLTVYVNGYAVATGSWQPITDKNNSPSFRSRGTYLATSQTVLVYAEGGNPKGSFTVYLHHGKKYIQFQNSWVCIQGKSRFSFNGNWYVIR